MFFNRNYGRGYCKCKKIGFKTNLLAINPINNEKVPIYFANFVLMDYGLGAVFGVLRTIKEILILQKNII